MVALVVSGHPAKTRRHMLRLRKMIGISQRMDAGAAAALRAA